MEVTLVTGSAGLVGSTAILRFARRSQLVIGVDNDTRGELFGANGSIVGNIRILKERLGDQYLHEFVDIRDEDAVDRILRTYGRDIEAIIHTAAQPSHDWAATDPVTDFSINAAGTLNLLEATRRYARDAVFVYLSTSKVYGDRPNRLPFVQLPTRWDLPSDHPLHGGIDEDFGVDQCVHSLFGASKLSGDVFVQEYGRYFGLVTGVFRVGCVTGARHAGVEQHGFLSHLVKTLMGGDTYTIFGYEGKQVRDNIHAEDLVRAIEAFASNPDSGQVYNLGGSRRSNCSVREAIAAVEDRMPDHAKTEYRDVPRRGDHRWYISNCSKFRKRYPEWTPRFDMEDILDELVQESVSGLSEREGS